MVAPTHRREAEFDNSGSNKTEQMDDESSRCVFRHTIGRQRYHDWVAAGLHRCVW